MLRLGLVENTPKSFKVVLFGVFIANDDGVLKGIPYKKGDVFWMEKKKWREVPSSIVEQIGFIGPKVLIMKKRGSIFDSGTNWFRWTTRLNEVLIMTKKEILEYLECIDDELTDPLHNTTKEKSIVILYTIWIQKI